MKKILIIEDDPVFLAAIANTLSDQFQPVTAQTGKAGVRMAVEEKPDVILVDVDLPELNGFEVCRRLREQPATRDTPILMVTGMDGVEDRVRGLELGADDYISKPFSTRELVARIRARLRTVDTRQRAVGTLRVGNLTLDPKSSSVTVAGKPVELTQAEIRLLRYFLERPNEIVSREKLLGDLWPDAVVENRTVDAHVAHLRKKLRDFDCRLRTVFRAGYRMEVNS